MFSAEPQPWELAYRFMRELERPEMLLRTDLPNALGCFDTVHWGAASKKAVVAALRDALERAVPELMRTREDAQTCSNCGDPLHTGEAIKPDGKDGWRPPPT